MDPLRRKVLLLSLGVAACPFRPRSARADSPATRPIHILVGYSVGGIVDLSGRLIGQALQQKLGQSVVVDNRLGAGGNIAAETVVDARPDGGTLILAGPYNAINATLYNKLPFDFIRDIAMVAGIWRDQQVLVINPAVPAKSLAELIAYAKANPGNINMASAGNGSTPHMAGELFMMMAGVSMVHVPYRGGGDARGDLVTGRVQLMFAPIVESMSFISDGRLRALAVTSSSPSPLLPGIPPVASVVPGYEVIGWYGLGAPKATPAGTITALNNAVNACLAEPALANRIHELGAKPWVMSPRELDAFVVDETQRWAKVVKFSGAKVD
jgi:tripartite-type tricarboxylate transporter receptor subunit TctC